ncbi:MAG: hypothetical protein AMS27_06130 [Bacteroides sp. SM23_62_1]|nr:MAG: hypothetical protein AMS27_06130 [Bacteroides sp. SM23_62_1]
MLTKVRGIVLHHLKFKESSVIVHMYTDMYGRQAYVINNVMGKKGGHRSNLLQPLFFLELEVYYKQERDLKPIRDFNQYISFRTIPYDLYKSTQALFIAEILYKSLREEEAAPELFDFLINSIQWLDTAEKHFANFHILFLVQLTKYLGFFPDNNYSPINRYFDLRNGQFTGNEYLHTDIMGIQTSKAFHMILKKTFNDLPGFSIKKETRQQLLTSLTDYYRQQIHGFGNIRSLPVLREIFE